MGRLQFLKLSMIVNNESQFLFTAKMEMGTCARVNNVFGNIQQETYKTDRVLSN